MPQGPGLLERHPSALIYGEDTEGSQLSASGSGGLCPRNAPALGLWNLSIGPKAPQSCSSHTPSMVTAHPQLERLLWGWQILQAHPQVSFTGCTQVTLPISADDITFPTLQVPAPTSSLLVTAAQVPPTAK